VTLGRGRDPASAGYIGPLLAWPRPRPGAVRSLGEIAYGAYRDLLATRGQPAPEWRALDQHHRAALEAAGTAVRAALARAVPDHLPPSVEARRARP
jgi:hypothetical protein